MNTNCGGGGGTETDPLLGIEIIKCLIKRSMQWNVRPFVGVFFIFVVF